MKIPVVFAQQPVHELSLYGSGGLSTLRYKLSLGDRSGSMGTVFGMGYTYSMAKDWLTDAEKLYNERWGIHTGIEFASYNAKAKIKDAELITNNLIDSDGDAFDLYTELSGYSENQRAIMLNIPVMAVFQISKFYAMGGFKFGIPPVRKFKSNNLLFNNEANYDQWYNWAKTQTFAGYGAFSDKNSQGNFKLGMSVIFALEAGMNWRINENFSVYAGAYFDYGLNNLAKDRNLSFIRYNFNNPENFSTNSVLSSYTDKIKIMAAGIKVRIAMDR
jgi:hypothetical protein